MKNSTNFKNFRAAVPIGTATKFYNNVALQKIFLRN
jgi:hypothetical protein